MRNLFAKCLGLTALAVVLSLALFGQPIAQVTGNYLPVPNNVFTAKGAVVVTQDEQNLTGVAAGAAGYLLTGAGSATLPAFTTAIVQQEEENAGVSVSANSCAKEDVATVGVLATDSVMANLLDDQDTSKVALVAVDPSDNDGYVTLTWCNSDGVTRSAGGGTIRVLAIRT